MDKDDDKKRKFGLGLIPRLLLGIAFGILLGSIAPVPANRVIITFSTIFGSLLRFVIPLMILTFITMGIAELTKGAGKMLGLTLVVAYISTLVGGSIAYLTASNLFPFFIDSSTADFIINTEAGTLNPYFTAALTPVIDVMGAIVLALIFGLSISTLRSRNAMGNVLYDFFGEFSQVISFVLNKVIIPLLPLYICGTFINLTVSGTVLIILGVLWKVFLTVIVLHLVYLLILFFIGGSISKKSPFVMIKNQIPGYLSALGTQSSVATIPINLECAERNGISKEVRNFLIPLYSNIHIPGSMITITCCTTAVLLMYGLPHSFGLIVPFILVLGIAMMAAPGAPGGAIMSALPFLTMVGIAPDGAIASLMIALYITQDSFGTACNVSGDNAISAAMDTFYKKHILKKTIELEQAR